jgi:hypothetical protein
MATGRNFSMSGIYSRHHYLPTFQILMISDNVEFLPPIFMPCFGSHFENGRHLENFETQNCSSNGDLSLCQNVSHIFGGSKGVGVTIESYGKLEISYINVDNF